MDITLKEAIELILNFRHFPAGFWKDIPIENPIVAEFIKKGFATLDAERQEKYELNDKGADFLHGYIKQISMNFIEFLKKKHFSCFDSEATFWFSNTFGLDSETASDLYDYITFNLETYGYKRMRFHQSENGCGYHFEKLK